MMIEFDTKNNNGSIGKKLVLVMILVIVALFVYANYIQTNSSRVVSINDEEPESVSKTSSKKKSRKVGNSSVWKYVNKKGMLIFTSDYNTIPAECHRSVVKVSGN